MHLSLSTLLWVGCGWLAVSMTVLAMSALGGRPLRPALAFAQGTDADADALRAPVRERVVPVELAVDVLTVPMADAPHGDGSSAHQTSRRLLDDPDQRAAI